MIAFEVKSRKLGLGESTPQRSTDKLTFNKIASKLLGGEINHVCAVLSSYVPCSIMPMSPTHVLSPVAGVVYKEARLSSDKLPSGVITSNVYEYCVEAVNPVSSNENPKSRYISLPSRLRMYSVAPANSFHMSEIVVGETGGE